MGNAMNIARTGLEACMEIIAQKANDASNAHSIAYKSTELMTSSTFYTKMKQTGLPDSAGFSSPVSVQRGSGAKIAYAMKIMTQGDKKDTNNPLDLYINGGGYFAVNLPNNKIGYTRVGAFRVNSERKVVTINQGYSLVDDITIPLDIDLNNVVIDENGLITNKMTGDELGQIHISTFPNELALEDIGGGIALETQASGTANEYLPGDNDSVGKILQFGLEMSNVSQIEALTALMEAQRAYELMLKMVSADNEIAKTTNETHKG